MDGQMQERHGSRKIVVLSTVRKEGERRNKQMCGQIVQPDY